MKHRVSQELYAYWDHLRGARAAPERGDIDPAAIRTILADTVLLEVAQAGRCEPREAIIRLSGTRLDALWSNTLKGRPLASLWRSADRDTIRDMTDLVMDDQVPVVAGARCSSRAQGSTEVEILLLPLRHHGKTHRRLLGSIVPKEPPPWLGVHPLPELTLTSFRNMAPPARPIPRGLPALMPGLRATAAHMSSRPTRHGRFMVYEGGR